MLDRFFAANGKACSRITPYLPQAKTRLPPLYEQAVVRYMNAKANQVVVDAGGGKECRFARYRETALGTRIIAVDVSAKELEHNVDVDEKRVADLTQDLPFSPGEVDLLVSNMVLEHLENLESFVANSGKAIKRGGYVVHLFPSRFAPFSLINRALPPSLSRKVLNRFRPKSTGGFPAIYDGCYYSGAKELFEKHGFGVVEATLSYYQSSYFRFFVPFFLISALYELIIWSLGAKNLAAFVLIVAYKK